jgi:hypothetical protein
MKGAVMVLDEATWSGKIFIGGTWPGLGRGGRGYPF